MIDLLKVLFLACLQGIAEFLPVSSSGHLVLAKRLLHVSMPGITLEVALHAGTLLSVCVFYFSSLLALCKGALKGSSAAWRYLAAIVVSMVPCGVAYALFGDRLEEAFGDARFVGLSLIFTGLLLLTIRQKSGPEEEAGTSYTGRRERPNLFEAAAIGVGQAVAMLPGVSRSGTTIWVARLLRIPPEESARFSFLMSVPVIGGATLLEILSLFGSSEETTGGTEAAGAIPLWMIGVGAVVSAVVGYASLTLLVRMLRRGKFRWFGVYCLTVGVASTVYFWLRG
jgi:undecaprenyl-diphosphatase